MKRVVLIALLAGVSGVTCADTIGTYLTGDAGNKQALTISYKDDQHIRMDVGQGNYMLVTGAKAYMVTGQAGRVTVIDLDTLPKFALPTPKKPANPASVKLTKTGRSETIAGIKGEVYTIAVDGAQHEAVLSADKRALGLNKAFMALAKRMSQSLGAEASAQIELATREAQKYGYGGLLRSDQNMVLQSVADKAMPVTYYALPAGAAPMQMPKMPQMDPAAMQQMQQQMQEMMKQQQGK